MLQPIVRPRRQLDSPTRRERESRFLKTLFDQQSRNWGAYHALDQARERVRHAVVRQPLAETILYEEQMAVAGEIDRVHSVIMHRMRLQSSSHVAPSVRYNKKIIGN